MLESYDKTLCLIYVHHNFSGHGARIPGITKQPPRETWAECRLQKAWDVCMARQLNFRTHRACCSHYDAFVESSMNIYCLIPGVGQCRRPQGDSDLNEKTVVCDVFSDAYSVLAVNVSKPALEHPTQLTVYRILQAVRKERDAKNMQLSLPNEKWPSSFVPGGPEMS